MLASNGNRVVHLDVAWLVPADLWAVDALARLQVAASRCERWLLLHGAERGLIELVEFAGLSDVVYVCSCFSRRFCAFGLVSEAGRTESGVQADSPPHPFALMDPPPSARVLDSSSAIPARESSTFLPKRSLSAPLKSKNDARVRK